jgi:membrane-associated phospholipid phosphatase
MSTVSLLLIFVLVVFVVLLLHEVSRHALTLLLDLGGRLPKKFAGSSLWRRSNKLRFELAERFPRVSEFFRIRTDPREPTGLPLTLMLAAALYLAALFSGLTEDILEAQGIIHIDNVVHASFVKWRVEPLTVIFRWITALGSSPAVVAAVIIATGFLWSQRRLYIVAPLWITCLGAVASTSIGKLLIGRHRPPGAFGLTEITSSFPSGHATASMAVYGFLAYTIARNLPSARERFEVGYWTSILILFVGFSRVFLGAHYFTDVIGGFLVGGFWLLAGFTIAEWTGRARLPAPKLHRVCTLRPRHEDDENR